MATQGTKRKNWDEDLPPRASRRKVLKITDEEESPCELQRCLIAEKDLANHDFFTNLGSDIATANPVSGFKRVGASVFNTPATSASSLALDIIPKAASATVSAAVRVTVRPTVTPSLLDRIEGHGIGNLPKRNLEVLLNQLATLPDWVAIKEKISEAKFKKITAGMIIWDVYAKKTTNNGASVARSDYLPTSDGLYNLKGAPWIIEFVNENSWSFECRRLTTHSGQGDVRLTPAQLSQTLRVQYPGGGNNSNVHGLPVVHARWCSDAQAGNRISLISMNEIRTIWATKDIYVWGELDPRSTDLFLERCSTLQLQKHQSTRAKLKAENPTLYGEAAPTAERRPKTPEQEHGPLLVCILLLTLIAGKLTKRSRDVLKALFLVYRFLTSTTKARLSGYQQTRASLV
jgi:hypothetical protein